MLKNEFRFKLFVWRVAEHRTLEHFVTCVMTLILYIMCGEASAATGNGPTTSLLIPVSRSSVVFDKVLAPLQNAYLHEESKEAFRYPSAFLFKNPTLQEKYEAFRANRREAGYSEEELKEGYGFLLFDDINKAAELGETGVLTGNSTCKTLGDPSKGVYIARYSDCLAPDHWYSGKSGFIVIVRLTKGRSNKVKENYTQNCISPSVGFDCHESKELPLVSANTSSFLAFERTQYYLYEALPGDCVKTNLAPRHVCPFAIVPFSYDDANTRVTMSCSQKQSGTEGNALNDFMWRGQLQISSQIFHVWLKSRARALIPVKLPPVVKVDQAVSMVTLRQFAPKAVFETRFSGEVCLDGICCSVHEFVPIEVEDPSLSLLIRELKDKDLGLTVHLNDSGFLILLHSSNFATCTGNGSTVTEALQAMFLFPGSRAIHKDTRGESEHSQISSDILRGLPALDYAEIEMQKSSMGPSEDISGQFVQQIKNYAALIQTGLAATQSKDVSPVSQDYDESVTSLFSNPKWTNRLWQWLRSYLSHPVSFQLPVYSVTELLAAGNKLQKEVLNEDLPPLEQGPGTVCSTGPEELLIKSTACDVSSSWQKDVDKKDSETNSILNCPLSRNPAAELVVSITSAEGMSKVMDEGLSGSDAVVATKQLCNTLMATTNTVDKNPLEDSTERKKRPRGRPKGKRKRFKWSSPPADEPLTPTSDKPDEETLANDTPETEWTILSMSQCKGGKLTYKYKKVPRSPQLQEDQIEQTKSRRMENVSSTRSDDCSLLKKTDRWDLRPILTACGRTLVPFGSLNSLLQKDESAHRERRLKETLSETSEEASQQKKMEEDPVAGGLAAHSTNNVISEDGCHNTEVGSPRSETASSPPELRDRSVVNVAEADSTGHVSSSTADDPSHLTDRDKSERLLCKLKKLFSRRKRKTTPLVLGDSVLPVDAQLSTETLLKKRKSDKETLNTESNTDCQDSRESNKDVLIAFAQALGLMPIEVPDKREETENMDTLEQRLPLSLEGQLIPPEVESAQVMQMVPSPVQENPQMKRVLQKRRTKWGKLFHTPSSSTTKRPKNNECATSNSFEMNLKEQFCSNGQSNALSLLADLALGDNQALPQLDPRSNVDNLLSDGTKLDNQLVLPSMLQQPADGPVLPSNSPSPEGILGSKDVIGLIAKEHDYSWSTASQVPKTTSPAGTPEHSQNLSGPELPTLSSVPPEGPREHRASVEYMNKDAIRSRRFRRSRIFVENDGFLQVTRKWKGNYDFDLDSKFTNHPVEKTVCRGLHGSWNSAVKDNGEEAQLLIHIWIGLFYSRSTPRFIHSSPLDLEDCLERSDGNVSLPTVPEAAPVAVWNSDTQYLEPIQEDRLFLNQGAEILDLSIKKQDLNDRSDISVSRHETNGKEASEAFIREAGIQDGGPAQYQAKQKALQVYRSRPSEFDDDNDGNDDNIVKSTSKRANASPPSATNREHSAVNSLSEEKTCDSLCKVIANIIIQPQLVVETQASIDPESSHIDTSEMRERKENLQNAEVAVDPPIETDSACEIMKGIVEDPISLCTVLVATEENDHDESKCEDHRNNADSCLPLIDKEDSTTGHKSPVPYVNLPENETQSADVRSITLTHGSKENRNEDEDCQSASDQGQFTKEEDNNLKPKSVSDDHGTIKGDDPGGSGQLSAVRRSFEEDGKKDASTDDIHKIEIFREREKSNDSTPLQDGFVVERQAEVEPDVSVVSCDQQEQDDELMENEEETSYILAQKAASHHPAPSPQDGVSKLLQDPSEKPVVGKDDSKQEVEAGPQVLPLQDNPVKLGHETKEMATNIDVCQTSLVNGEKVPIAENVLSVFEDRDSKHELGSEDSELDERCSSPTKGNGPGGYFQLSLVGEPNEGDGTKDASSDEMLWMQYENAMGGDGDDEDDDGGDAISEENFNLTLDESIPEEFDNDFMDEANIEIESQQSNSDNNSTPLQDGVEGESRAKVLPDVSVVSCDQQEQDDELMENEEETSYILAQKAASHHPAPSPQDGVSKLLQDPSEMPLFVKDDSKQEVEAGPQVLPFQDNPVELGHEPKEMATNIDVCHTSLVNCEKVPIAENVLSVSEDRDSEHELGSEDSELYERCPPPTNWDNSVGYCQATLVRQPYEGDGKKDASSDEMLQTQYAHSNTFMSGDGDDDDTDGYDTISDENLSLALDKTLPEEPDHNDSINEANIEIESQQNKSENDPTPLQDGVEGESRAEVLPDVSVVSCDQQEQDDELMENEEETSYILAQKAASHHPAPSPQDGVSKLLQDPSEMPLFVKDDSKQEVEAGPQVLPFQDNPVELGHEPKEMATNIDVCHTSLVNGEKVPIAENVLSVFKDRDSKHKLGSEDSELDERCSPPTKGNGPVDYFQLSLVGEPNEGDGTKDASSDEMLQTQYANAYSFMAVGVGDYDGDDVVSEENLNIALDKTLPEEPDHNDSINEANIEIVSQQNKSENDPTPLQDGVEGESQAEVEPDVSVVSCDHQEPDDELVENEVETACILAQTSGPQVLPSEMANEPNEMAMNINVYHMSLENSKKVQIDKNILSVFKECNSEHKLGSETSEFDERCPTPTIDEKPYEDFPSLELSISNEQGQNSTHCLGKEVDAEPELKAVGDQVPGRDLCEDSQTPSYRLLETTDLPPSLHHSPTLRRESMDMDNLNDKTSLVNVGITPAKQLRVKRSRFSDVGCSLLVPCPLKKMSNDRKKCGAPVQRRLRDASHPYRLNPVVVLQPLTGLQWTDSQAVDIYKVKEMDNPAISKMSDDNQTKIPVIPTTLTDTLLDNRRDVSNLTSKGDQHENEQELCSKADRVSVHGAGECVLNKTNDIDALSHVEGRDPWKPSTTVPSIVSTQSDEGDNLSSSSFQDPIQDCPVAKRLGHSSSIHTDPSTSSFKYTNYRFTKTVSKSLGQLTETCMNSDLTQFSMEQEFLIFSEEMKQLLIGSKRGPGKNPDHRSMHSYPSSDGPQSVLDLSMDVDEPESGMEETKGEKISRHRELSSRGNSAEADVALSNIEAECARSYHTVMDNICAGRSCMTETEGALRERAGPIRQMRREMFGSLNHGLNLVVRQSSKTKFKFYILKTSEDAFFKETKAQLEGDGHTEEQPYHFLLNTQSSSSSLLLIILKNEDIAEHIIKVPHLLDLKKSANVLFAGIDHPKDIGNLTHQDIFKKGGFIVLEGIALEALRFCQMKALLDFLQELSKNGKWKWILHYRDIRRLKENSRFNAEEMEKKNLMKSCQETGIVEVLPYHECDQTCRPHPRYLKCLLQLQVQNITARFPVFVTDITNPTEDKSFERHGILTMNINSLLNVIESEKFSPSTSI